jgi:Zn finger protein HypA/HybF involved in hydrogenase expression
VHELALVADLVEAAVARVEGPKAHRVVVRYASTIPADVFEQAWAMLTAGGPLDGAELDASQVPVRLACPCGFDDALGHDDVIGPGQAVCPTCSELRSFPVRPELELVEVA